MTAISEARARQARQIRRIWYCAHPTRRHYSFDFKYRDDGWRVYVNNPPHYGRQSDAEWSTHLMTGQHGRRYICWDTEIDTLSAAQAVAALWADSTENYIATGRFNPAPGRPLVVDRSVLNGFSAS